MKFAGARHVKIMPYDGSPEMWKPTVTQQQQQQQEGDGAVLMDWDSEKLQFDEIGDYCGNNNGGFIDDDHFSYLKPTPRPGSASHFAAAAALDGMINTKRGDYGDLVDFQNDPPLYGIAANNNYSNVNNQQQMWGNSKRTRTKQNKRRDSAFFNFKKIGYEDENERDWYSSPLSPLPKSRHRLNTYNYNNNNYCSSTENLVQQYQNGLKVSSDKPPKPVVLSFPPKGDFLPPEGYGEHSRDALLAIIHTANNVK